MIFTVLAPTNLMYSNETYNTFSSIICDIAGGPTTNMTLRWSQLRTLKPPFIFLQNTWGHIEGKFFVQTPFIYTQQTPFVTRCKKPDGVPMA